MDKIKRYWMPVVAALCVIAGLSDFSPAAILFGAGFGYTWWKDVRENSSVNKKAVAVKIIQWLLAGIGFDMLFQGSIGGGVLLLTVDALWIFGKLGKISASWKKSTSRISNIAVRNDTNSPACSEVVAMPEEERIKAICQRTIEGAWQALSDCNCSDAPLLTELKQHLKKCASSKSDIVSIETYPFYVGCMKAEVENRWWKRISTKLVPGSATGVEHQKIDIWSVAPGALKGAYSEEDCPECHREGRIKCPTCHGEHAQWDCPDCHGEAGVLHECPECDGNGEVECPDCHGKLETECRECHGKGRTECPDCHGSGKESCSKCFGDGIVQELHLTTCPECHGTGRDSRDGRCAHCDGSGKSSELFKEPCPICHGEGHIDCDTCHSSGYLECKECHGVGKVECNTCQKTGKVVCYSCSGKGKLKCSKCDSTGIEHCHTCKGGGTVSCPKCHGDGAFAYIWNAISEKAIRGQTVAWTEADIPQDALPRNEFYSENDVVGVSSLFAKESTKNGYDLALLDGIDTKYLDRMEALFKDFTIKNDLSKDTKVSSRILHQSLGIEKIDGLAKVVIQAHGTPSDGLFENAKYTVWINLVTGTLLKVSAEGIFPSKYALCFTDAVTEVLKIRNSRKRAPIDLTLALMGSAAAMKDYSILVRNGDGVDKSESQAAFWNEFAVQFGSVTTVRDGMFKRKFISPDNWNWVLAHLPKMMAKCNQEEDIVAELLKEFPDSKKHLRLNSLGSNGIRRALERDPRLVATYDFSEFAPNVPGHGIYTGLILEALLKNQQVLERFHPTEWINVLKAGYGQDLARVRKLARKCDFSRFSPEEMAEAIWEQGDIVSEVFDLNRLSVQHWVRILDKPRCPAEKFRKYISHFSEENLLLFLREVELKNLSGYKYRDLIDWQKVSNLPVNELILLAINNDTLYAQVDLSNLPSLQTFDWRNLTDDQRVDFAIEHEDIAPIVLKCGFDPNKLRPWCLDLAYDKWPERMSSFNPKTYDWTQCSTCMWAQIAYGHPEFVKYCPVDEIDWHELDDEKIKYWKWALGAFGEKVAPQFTKWNGLDEERWNDILKKQPALAGYKKKYGKKS